MPSSRSGIIVYFEIIIIWPAIVIKRVFQTFFLLHFPFFFFPSPDLSRYYRIQPPESVVLGYRAESAQKEDGTSGVQYSILKAPDGWEMRGEGDRVVAKRQVRLTEEFNHLGLFDKVGKKVLA